MNCIGLFSLTGLSLFLAVVLFSAFLQHIVKYIFQLHIRLRPLFYSLILDGRGQTCVASVFRLVPRLHNITMEHCCATMEHCRARTWEEYPTPLNPWLSVAKVFFVWVSRAFFINSCKTIEWSVWLFIRRSITLRTETRYDLYFAKVISKRQHRLILSRNETSVKSRKSLDGVVDNLFLWYKTRVGGQESWMMVCVCVWWGVVWMWVWVCERSGIGRYSFVKISKRWYRRCDIPSPCEICSLCACHCTKQFEK